MSTTDTQTFSVVFTIPGIDSLEEHLAAFAQAGCGDAAFMGPAMDGTFVAEFDREQAAAVADAVVSAIADLAEAVPGLRPLRVLPE